MQIPCPSSNLTIIDSRIKLVQLFVHHNATKSEYIRTKNNETN